MTPDPPILFGVVLSLLLLANLAVAIRNAVARRAKPAEGKDTTVHQMCRETRAIATETRDLVRGLKEANILAEARSEEHIRIMGELRVTMDGVATVLRELLIEMKTRRAS